MEIPRGMDRLRYGFGYSARKLACLLKNDGWKPLRSFWKWSLFNDMLIFGGDTIHQDLRWIVTKPAKRRLHEVTCVHQFEIEKGNLFFTQLTCSSIYWKNSPPKSSGEIHNTAWLGVKHSASYRILITQNKMFQKPSTSPPTPNKKKWKGGRAKNLAQNFIDSGNSSKNGHQKTLPKILLLLMMMFCCKGAPNLIPVGNDHSWSDELELLLRRVTEILSN